MEQDRAPNPVLRVLSALGGIVVLLVSLLFSLGASLGAPVGFYVASRRARRRGRPLNRIASLLSAVLASIITLVLGVLVVFAVLPPSVRQEMAREMEKGVAESQAQHDTIPPPEWAKKMFPRTAQSDSAAKRFATSPNVFYASYGIAVLFTCVVFGAIGGGMGWVATVLLRYAVWGVRT